VEGFGDDLHEFPLKFVVRNPLVPLADRSNFTLFTKVCHFPIFDTNHSSLLKKEPQVRWT
jgi:hypothetical protein